MFFFEQHGKAPEEYWFKRNCIGQLKEVFGYLQLSEKERAQTDPPTFIIREQNLPGSSVLDSQAIKSKLGLTNSLTKSLSRITYGKCAFCETVSNKLEPYRYRPLQAKDRFRRHDNMAYLWLIWEWSNFFPICPECKPSNPDFFPVEDSHIEPNREDLENWQSRLSKIDTRPPSSLINNLNRQEKPLILRPGNSENVSKHFGIDRETRLIPLTENAAATIKHFNLNSHKTLVFRKRKIDHYLDRFLKYGSNLEPNLSRLEYGGSWYMFVRTLLSPMLKDSGLKGTLAPNQIFSTTVKLYTHSVWKDINKYLNADDTFPGIEETFQNTERDLLGEEHPEDMAYALPPKIDTGEKRAEIIGAQPRLTGISVENFKSLASIDIKIGKVEDQSKLVTQDVEYNHHTDCLLMLGENATGKSSLLEAVAMATISSGALTALQDDPVIGIKPDHLILNPKYMGSPKAKVPKAAKIKLTFKDNTDTNITRSLAINPKGFVQSKSTEDDILIFAYGAHRLFGISGKDDEADNPAQDVLTLFRNDVMTIDPEKWLIELDTRNDGSLDIIARALRHVIQLDGKFENIEIVREKGQKPFCQINLKRAQIGTALGDDVGTDESYIFSTPMKYVSSGYRVIIALICDVFKGIMEHLERRVGDSGLAVTAELAREMSVLILIDEVEAHLHPRWKLEVISGLRRALPQATFLMSSHDPLCIRGMNNGEVIVFHRYQLDNGSDKVTREKVETITEFPDFRQLTVEQLLTSELFSLYSTDDRRIEKEFGNIITLLAQEKQGEINKSGQDMLTAFRSHVTEQLHKALPVGSTEIDRLVHEAVEEFLSKRRTNNQAETDKLRHAAKIKIIDALEKIAGPTA